MGVSWQEDKLFLVSSFDHHADEPFQAFLNLFDFIEKPQPHVCRDLIIARSSRMEFSSKRTDELAQSTFVRCMNILIIGLNRKLNICVKNQLSGSIVQGQLTMPSSHSCPTAVNP